VPRFTSLVLMAGLLTGPAGARDWKVQGDAGQRIAAHAYCTGIKQRTCAETALPKVEITTPPKNGAITFGNTISENVFNRVGEVRTGKLACPSVPHHCVQIYYTPTANYHGADQFSYTVFVADGQQWRDTIAVDVR
jgi:Big-like domain-containing protein